MTSASNSFTADLPLYDVWLVIVGRGAGLFDHCGVSDITRAERLVSDYHRQACTLGLPHFTYVVHRRGDPHPPPWQEDDLPFGDDRLPLPSSSVQMVTYTEEELFGTRPTPPPLFRECEEGEGETMQESDTEEHLLASFLRGELLHEDNRLHDEEEGEEEEAEMEPDELYRVTWPYRHDYRPPSLSSAEKEGGEDEDDDDALFSF